jgi:hypothetical protein
MNFASSLMPGFGHRRDQVASIRELRLNQLNALESTFSSET